MTDALERLRAALADRYTIERELGQGGMATVYLAEDLRHHRKVALKVLRPELSAVLGGERFLKEIEVTASLQHPHLLPLFDSGEAEGLLFYVMPYVEGESLRERLTRETQLGVEEAVRLTTQVASALDYAHRRGVVHRDIKPENILLEEGQALIADFGIALALRHAGGPRLTDTGLSLGTPQYMSPEQASGSRALDARSDIYSLACVLYEMLAGEPPHTGPTAQAVIAKLLVDRPRPLMELRDTVPVHISAALDVALAKLPADRFATVSEFVHALGHPADTVARLRVAGGAYPASAAWDRRSRVLASAVVVLAAALAFSALRSRTSAVTPAVYDIALPDSARISFTGGSPWGEGWTALAVAPRGDFAVYVAERGTGTELWYRSLADTVAHPIAGTRGAYFPMLAPDAQSVAFFAGNHLMVVPVTGGTPVVVGEVNSPFGGQWVTADRILVAGANGTRLDWYDRVTRTSHTAATVPCTHPDAVSSSVVICGGTAAYSYSLSSVAAGQPFRIGAPGSDTAADMLAGSAFRLADPTHLIFMALDGTLSAAAVQMSSHRTGHPVGLIPGVRREGFSYAGQYALAASGTLVYVPGDNAEVGGFARIREGAPPIELPIARSSFGRFDLTRDGRRLAAELSTTEGNELWVYDLATGSGERLLRADYRIGEPRWDPAGQRLVVDVIHRRGGRRVTLLLMPGSASAPDTLLRADTSFQPFHFFSESLLVGDASMSGHHYTARLDLRTRPPRIDSITQASFCPTLSPDGRWLAYSTLNPGRWEVFLERFPPDGRRFKVSPNGGTEPIWRSPTRLVFRSGSEWFESRVEPAAAHPVGEPRLIVQDPRFIDTGGRSNLGTADGSIIYVRGTGQFTGSFLRVIPRFVSVMRQRVREAERP